MSITAIKRSETPCVCLVNPRVCMHVHVAVVVALGQFCRSRMRRAKLDSRATTCSIWLRLPQVPCVGSVGKPQRSQSIFGTQRSPRAALVTAVTSRGSLSAVEAITAARHMSGGAYDIQPERRIRHLTDVLTKGPQTFDAVVIGAGTRSETVEAPQACLRAQSSREWLHFLCCGQYLYRLLPHFFRRCRRVGNMQSFSDGRAESHPTGASQCNWHRNKFAE